MPRITVFTPTYNRAACLKNLYNSLKNQTCRDFVWLVIDDGSTDDTKTLLKNWEKDAAVPILWAATRNHGKPYAHNLAVSLAKTELFFCVDSDDTLYPRAIEKILAHWDRVQNKAVAGIIGYKTAADGPVSGAFFTKQPQHFYTFCQNGLTGDAALVYRTDILRQYPFPIFENETFITENTVYAQIDRLFLMSPFAENLVHITYREDGYSSHALELLYKNPKGWAFYHLQSAAFAAHFRKKFYHLCQGICFCWLCRAPFSLKGFSFWEKLAAFPFGFLLFLKRKWQYRPLKGDK